jgi:putative acyl-CoA dehydrogenase
LAAARAPLDAEYEARRLAEGLALAVVGSLLARNGRPEVWHAFAASRLANDHGSLYGTLPVGLDVAGIIEPAIPRQ